ncbi:MAG TPA: acetoacetate--CoA ligase, partial [Thermodesulfobacteriota bacterium]|nr:acetoacetate--CoA ligase [Thermodesulfobacteriota bacterium]
PLWEPSAALIKQANMTRFMHFVNRKYGKDFQDYPSLYNWSIDQISDFWAAMWEFAEIKTSRSYEKVVDDSTKMPGAHWFVGAQLNFAENLLRYRDDRVALVFKGEGREPQKITYKELYARVAAVAKALRASGVTTGDRVVGFMPNMMETVIAMLGATSLGAVWSSCSPDFGIKGVLDRFGQIEPKVLFTADGYSYNGKVFDSIERIADIVKDLPSLQKVVVVPYIKDNPEIAAIPQAVHYRDFAPPEMNPHIEFVQVSPDHPLYIMYSSGTTGLPKCMVQGVAGILVHHLKELMLHTDLKREDTIFYFTTCGWMMWNWLISSLACGATLVLFDGSPFYPDPGVLWKLVQDEKITVFGISARYVASLEKEGIQPGKQYDLTSMRAMLSTGSPLPNESFQYIYREVKKDVQLSSIAGGTDLNGCFGLGNPLLPVYEGELQCRGLGMKVAAYNDQGKPVINELGELVCTAPFPSMPLYFWNDPDNEKYLNAYFRVFPGVWCHGDFILITENGGIIMYGRSDATLNPGGVRIGTADIYRQVETLPEIADSVVIGQNWDNDVRIILFVKLAAGLTLDENLINKIKKTIRDNASPRHVPSRIISVADIPYTINMKKVELAVRNIVHGRPVLNKDALANPEALDLYKDLPDLKK